MSKKNSRSVFLAGVLRHYPEKIGLTLDNQGWADVDLLIKKMKVKDDMFSLEILENIVNTDSKQRYSFNSDKTKIRANQGHSLSYINISFDKIVPPDFLYHGTSVRFLKSIMQTGIEKRSRQFVHLSKDKETAISVGSRHGEPEVLMVLAKKMYQEGHNFYISENGVYLVDHVPVKYLVNP